MHMAIKVEQQLNMGSGTQVAPNERTIPWKLSSSSKDVKLEIFASLKPKFVPRSQTINHDLQGNSEISTT